MEIDCSMGIRYRIPFRDFNDSAYVVEVYRGDYTGEPTELVGAPSCFVVSGTDEDFMYHPVRTSSATIRVLDSDLLLDLYSINNQYAPVKLLKDGVLEWTGYIKPEQFTQPYVPTVQSVSVECVSALATLEHIEYAVQTESGYITLWELMKYLIRSANGGYRGVYVPHVYGKSSAMNGNVLDEILLCEENFTSQEMKLNEVLENVCKFLNWTVYDLKGCLYFVDADWRGVYRLYDEALTGYSAVYGNEVLLQTIGYNGSDGNTLDVVPGFNKASVKSVNHVFDEVIDEEPFEILDTVQTWEYDGGNSEGALRVIRQFKKPMLWKMHYYGSTLMNEISQDEAFQKNLNGDVIGCIETEEKAWHVTEKDGKWVPKETEFDVNSQLMVVLNGANFQNDDRYEAFSVGGVNSVWKDGAFGLSMQISYRKKYDYVTGPTFGIVATYLYFKLRIGEYCWNGSEWVLGDAKFRIMHNVNAASGFQPLQSNKTAEMPYRGLNGWIIELPNDKVLKGDLELTMYMNEPMEADCDAYLIRDFKLEYAKKDGVNDEGESGDRVYENVVNEAYMSEADEIEFGIGSYNKDGASYSKALLGDEFLEDNLFCAVVNENVRPEELMIRRIVSRYGATKIKLTEAIQMTDEVTPLSALSDRTMVGKRFRMTSGEWDYEQNRIILQMQEEAE